MGAEEWEGVAAAIHAGTGLDDPPVCAFELAVLCGLRLAPWGRADAALLGDMVRFPRGARPRRQRGLVAHELAHWALQWHGVEDTEDAARYVAGALVLPRQALDRDLRGSWVIGDIQRRHSHASAEMVARRITQIRSARGAVFDQGKLRATFHSPWLEPGPAECDRLQSLARAALEERAMVGEPRCYAWPVIDPPWHRVVVVAEDRGH